MEEEYIKESLIIDKTEIEKEDEIIRSIIRAKNDLETARRNFEYAKSNDLVDYYIYQIKANQAKMDYLIKLAKSKGIIVDLINSAEIRIENRAG